LRRELAALQEQQFDLSLIGFDDEELARLLAQEDVLTGLTDEDDAPPLPLVATCWPADLWNLGNHKLLVGDATDPDAVARLMGNDKADLIITDPPYGIDYSGCTAEHLKIQGDNSLPSNSSSFCSLLFGPSARSSNLMQLFMCFTPRPNSVSSSRLWKPMDLRCALS
jgi:hypothetical protein